MEFIFLDSAGNTLFTRADIESGHWTVQEYSVNADFPFILDKRIEVGQRIAFHDPATDVIQVFEIRNVQNMETDRYQQITAEHIAVSELSDEHIDRIELTNVTAQSALTTALNGTLWTVGTVTGDAGTQTFDISRGSVWDAVNNIQSTFNLYITPRIVISSAGAITNRYLDIAPAVGAWNGVRLSVRKNCLDPSVTYDDSNVLTALYAYGGNVDVTHSDSDDTQAELTIASVVWAAESGHPAKPAGQKYLEWPEKTAIYGRNGRPRFGYYQNSNITDANILIQKTWESLQATCEPKINISGTCADLYRLGYHDEPLRLHDTVIVDIEETGEVFRKQIITLDIDLLDPTANQPEIGDYIPNIVYYSRYTSHLASTGSGNVAKGGGGGGRGQPNEEKTLSDTYTAFVKTDDKIGLVIGSRSGDLYIKGGEIALAINKTGEAGSYETYAYVNGDHVNISSTTTAHMLTGSIVYDAQGRLVLKDSTGGGVYTERTESGISTTLGIWDRGNLTGGVMVQQINGQTGTKITLNADVIDITGVVSELSAYDVGVSSFTCAGQSTFEGTVYVEEDIQAAYGTFESLQVMDTNDDYHNINIYDAEVIGNTLTIYKLDGTSINFSKATTLSGAWGGSLPAKVLTVTASPQGETYQVQWGGSYATTRKNIEVAADGAASVQTVSGVKMLSIPVKVQSLTSTQGSPEVVHETSVTPSGYSDLVQSGSRSTNGTSYPDSSHIGFSSFSVNVPNTMVVDANAGTAQIGTGGSSSLTFSAGITYSSATHTYIARAIVDGVDMVPRRAASGTEAYTDGFNNGNANRSSDVGSVDITSDASSQTLQLYDQPYKIQTRYQKADGTWANGGSYVIKTPANRYADGYNAGGQTSWPINVSSSYGSYQGEFTPGTYIAPGYTTYSGTSETRPYRWYAPTAWLDFTTTAPAGTTYQGELNYNTIYYVRYQSPSGWAGNMWAGGYWKTKPDRYQEGYDDGVADAGKTDRGSFYCDVSTSQSVTTVTLTRTYSYHGNPDVFRDGANVRIYT